MIKRISVLAFASCMTISGFLLLSSAQKGTKAAAAAVGTVAVGFLALRCCLLGRD
jgi:hypothetical protein